MGGDAGLPRDPGQRREAKIAQYKREKALKEQVSVGAGLNSVDDGLMAYPRCNFLVNRIRPHPQSFSSCPSSPILHRNIALHRPRLQSTQTKKTKDQPPYSSFNCSTLSLNQPSHRLRWSSTCSPQHPWSHIQLRLTRSLRMTLLGDSIDQVKGSLNPVNSFPAAGGF